jgi:glycerol-3-phosphate dehydrogenase
VYLCEQGDLASGTSSASTKLIHGGLRYLENMDFRLVRESLAEREVLMRIAPHLVWPRRFVLPHRSGLRPAWMLRAGLWLYDRIGGRTSLPPSRMIDLTLDAAGLPLKPEDRRGFEYSDCFVDDSRLVILNAVDAAERGASMNPQTRCVSAEAQDGGWRLRVQSVQTEEMQQIRARILVNATGPWVNQVLRSVLKIAPACKVRLDKGSHIVVRRRFAQDRAYLFQNADRRVVFAIPFQSDFTLLGTTEANYRGDPAAAAISENEIEYLLRSVNAYCRVPVSRDEIVWSYSGVRALPEPSGASATQSRKLSREYVLALTTEAGAPLLNVYGGKITTYRTLAEAVLRRLSPFLPTKSPWTGNVPLPGGDIAERIEDFITACAGKYPFLDSATLRRLVCAYGTRINAVLGEARGTAELGKSFGGGLSEAELRYLAGREWAKTADDVLWRRTKLGLKLDDTGKMEVEAWFRDMPAPADAGAGNRKQQ